MDILTKNIISLWLIWQFFEAPKEILKGWKNYLKFNLNYWSVPVLLKTLLSPWRRYSSTYGKGLHPWRYFETFVFNMMSRIIGAVLRVVFIVAGLFIEVLILLGGVIVFLGWLVLPVILFFGFIFGLRQILF